MRARLRGGPSRTLSLLVAFAVGAGPLLGSLPVAQAAPKAASASEVQAEASGTPAPELDTPTSRHWRMADGSDRARLYTAPVQFKDASGKWRPIDTAIVPSEQPGERRAAGTLTKVSFRDPGHGRPVRLEKDGVVAEMELVGGTPRTPLTLGETAWFSDVARDTDLAYRVLADGVKEALFLRSADAPSSFSFDLVLRGAEVRQAPGGGFEVARIGTSEPVWGIAPLYVADVSGTPCPEASESVERIDEVTWRLTYEVPRTWLGDPSRVFPVEIDPTFVEVAVSPATGWRADTYIRELSVYAGTSFSGQSQLLCGRMSNSNLDDSRALLRFDLSSIADSNIRSAAMHVWSFQCGTNTLTYLRRPREYWSPGITWSSFAAKPTDPYQQQVLNGPGESVWDVHTAVTEWVTGQASNGGLQLCQDELTVGGQGPAHFKKFYSGDVTDPDRIPFIEVAYQTWASVSELKGAYVADGTDVVTVTVDATYPDPDEEIDSVQVGANIAAPSTSSARGRLTWSIDGQGSGWTDYPLEDGVVSVQTGASDIRPIPERCSSVFDEASRTRRCTFVFTILPGWGDVQHNRYDYRTTTSEPYDTGWMPGRGDFSVLPGTPKVSAEPVGLDWLTEPDADGDAVADTRISDDPSAGRGRVTLTWPKQAASGYRVSMFDGASWRLVGDLAGASSTTWDSAGIYPSDSVIAGMPEDSADDPFTYPFRSPKAATRNASVAVPGLAGAGVLVGDGTYLYARAAAGSPGPTSWRRLSKTGQDLGQVGPDLSATPCYSGFQLSGYLYGGWVVPRTPVSAPVGGRRQRGNDNVSGGAVSYTVDGMSADAPPGVRLSRTITFTVPPIDTSGLELRTVESRALPTADVLLVSDGARIYNCAYRRGTSVFDGFKVREYDESGTYVTTHHIRCTSYPTSGVIADGGALYFIEWTATDAARVTKVSTSDWQVADVWTLDQGATHASGGCFDAATRTFWLGALDRGTIYSHSDGRALDLRDDASPLYAKTPGTEMDGRRDYRFRVEAVNSVATSCAEVAVQLPDRTISANEDPRHTDADLGDAAGHALSARMDSGALIADVTDLEISSFGPGATLSRHYDSNVTSATAFAPGWRFDFEQRLDVGSGEVVYADAEGDRHRFIPGSEVVTQAAGGWRISDVAVATDAVITGDDPQSHQRSLVRDSLGVLHAVWSDPAAWRIYHASSGDDGASWSAPELIGTPSGVTPIDFGSPYIKVDSTNRLHVFWGMTTYDHYRLAHVYRDPFGVWSAPADAVTLLGSTHPIDEVVWQPNPALDADDDVQLVYDRGHYLGIALREWADGAWSPFYNVSAMQYDMIYQNTVPIGADLYHFFRQAPSGALFLHKRVGGTWSGPERLTYPATLGHSEVVDAAGRIWVFSTEAEAGGKVVRYAALTPATNTWTPWATLDAQAGADVERPSATVDAAGHIRIFYEAGDAIVSRVLDPATGELSEREQLTDPARDGVCTNPQARYQVCAHTSTGTVELVLRRHPSGGPAMASYVRFEEAETSQAASFTSPIGFAGTLSRDGRGWKITRQDRSYLTFDAAGTLTAETDANGNQTTYTRPDGDLLITAANKQTIRVDRDAAGKVLSAEYATADGTRRVEYSAADARVTYFPGTDEERGIDYTYADSRLSAIEAPAVPEAEWAFSYASGRLVQTSEPAASDVGIAYGTDSATLTRRGTVGGQADTAITERFSWDVQDRLTGRSDPAVSGTEPVWSRFGHSPEGDSVFERAPAGAITRRLIDPRGDTIAEIDPNGSTTSFVYDAHHQVTSETDPLGSVTQRTYDATGNLTREERTLDGAGARNRTEYSYNGNGTVKKELRALSATETAEVEYSDFAPNGEARTTIRHGVRLAVGGQARDLTETRVFDAFGNMLSETDAAGVPGVRNTYSPGTASRLVASQDASGVVTRHLYDALGRETESSRTAPDGAFDSWRRVTLDPAGRTIAEAVMLDATTTAWTVTHEIDPMGREVRTVHSVEGTTVTRYDARGNMTRSWGPAVSAAGVEASATRVTFDAFGREIKRWEPGASDTASTTTEYNPDGTTAKVTDPDGEWTRYTYDAAGQVICETTPLDEVLVARAYTTYDLGGRVVRRVDDDGVATAMGYDLADRLVSTTGTGTATTSYNVLGAKLAETEADGVPRMWTYDAAGRTLSSRVGTATTSYLFDGAGRTLVRTDPDGVETHLGYDGLGRAAWESEMRGGREVKRRESSFDAAGRIVSTGEMVAGVSTKWSYADGKGTRTRVRMGYPGADVDVSYSDKGEELSRVTSAGVSCTRTVTARDDARRAIGWTLTTPAGALSSVATYTADGKLVSASGAGYKDRSGALYTFTSTGRPASSDIDLAYNGAHVREDYEYGTYGYGTNRLTRAVTNGVTRRYSYDWGGRIAEIKGATGGLIVDGTGIELDYDSLGRLSSARDLSALPNASAATTYRYDERGRRISESRAAPSRPTTTTTYSWDGSDRLVTWRRAVGGASVATASFSYDASGQRTRSVLTTPGGTCQTSWVYEGLTLLSMSTTDSVGTVAMSYLYDETSRPYALAATLDTATPVLIGLVTTARGDVVEMIDEAGGALSYWRYDVWGNPTASATQGNRAVAARIAAVQPLRYAGYTYDAFSGLYYCSQRYYDPSTCQFISKDPAKADGEESAYQYCGGDPVGKVDPSGEWYAGYSDAAGTRNHHDWTLKWATEVVGIPDGWARTIAAGCKDRDDAVRYGWNPGHHFDGLGRENQWEKVKWGFTGPRDTRNVYLWEELRGSATDFRNAKTKAERSRALHRLGMGIHAGQDSLGHGNMTAKLHAKLKQENPFETTGIDPDNPSHGNNQPNGHRREAATKWNTVRWLRTWCEKAGVKHR